MVRFTEEQEALALVERLKQAGIEPEHIRIYEWLDVLVDGNLKLLKQKSRYGVEVLKVEATTQPAQGGFNNV